MIGSLDTGAVADRRVLVIDPWERPALAAVRALGRTSGFAVGVAGYDTGRRRAGPAASSRFAGRYDVIADPRGPAEAFAESLAVLIQRRGYEVLVASSDTTLARLATIEPVIPTVPVTGAGFRTLTDKIALATVCASIDSAYPATYAVESATEVQSAVEALGLPVVVKSRRSAQAGPADVRTAKGASYCTTLEQAQAAARRLRSADLDVIVQCRVRPVEKLNAAVIRVDGRSEIRYAHRVLREAPPSGGIGVSLETIVADDGPGAAAVDLLERVCDAAGYAGIAQAEFYRSADDGRLYLLDVNPRLWGSTWFAERLGLRITERVVRLALGMARPSQPDYEIGRRFHAPGVVRWVSGQARPMRALVTLLASMRPGDVTEIDVRDLMPIAVRLLARTKRPE